MAYQLNVTQNECDLLKTELSNTIDEVRKYYISGVSQRPRFLYKNIYTIIGRIKFDKKSNECLLSLGCVNGKGSYEPRYERCDVAHTYFVQHLKDVMKDLVLRFNNDNPRKGTLLFSYNQKDNVLKICTSGAMTISSRVFYGG